MANLELLGRIGDEVRMVVDHESGYSVPVVGRPVDAGRLEPAGEIVVQLSDVGVWASFRIESIDDHDGPVQLARKLTNEYVLHAAAARPVVSVREVPAPLRPAGVASGGHCTFRVAGGADDEMEQLWLLVKPGVRGNKVLYFRTRFRTNEVSLVEWSHIRASMIDKHRWDDAPQAVPPSIWPASTMALPSARLTLTHSAEVEALAKAAAIPAISSEDLDVVTGLLVAMARNDQPLSLEIPDVVIEQKMRDFVESGPPRTAKVLVRNWRELRTSMDVRAWVYQCLLALAHRRS